jgi:hypothetical protein
MVAQPWWCHQKSIATINATRHIIILFYNGQHLNKLIKPIFSSKMEELACVAYLYSRSRREKKKNRKFWIHPLIADRSVKILFNLFYYDLRKYEEKFFNYLRMSISSFDQLFGILKDDLTGQHINIRYCISPIEKLVVTLR